MGGKDFKRDKWYDFKVLAGSKPSSRIRDSLGAETKNFSGWSRNLFGFQTRKGLKLKTQETEQDLGGGQGLLQIINYVNLG